MRRHLIILGRIWIAYSILVTVGAIVGAGVLLVVTDEGQAAGEVLLVGLLSIPGIVGGYGLLRRRAWARILVLALGFVSLVSFPPIGTALGIYTIWVLFKKETVRLFVRGTS